MKISFLNYDLSKQVFFDNTPNVKCGQELINQSVKNKAEWDAMRGCTHFKEFMAEQKVLLQKSLDDNKWFLSEKIGHDVGENTAQNDFMKNHLKRVAAQFREFFCGSRCPDSNDCGWREAFKK